MSKQNSSGIPLRTLGRTGIDVTAIGFGGYHLGLVKDDGDAVRLVHESIDAGITFMDNAWEYHDGRSEELMGKAIRDRRDDVFLLEAIPPQLRRLYRERLGRRIPLARDISARHRPFFDTKDRFAGFAIQNEHQRGFANRGDHRNLLAILRDFEEAGRGRKIGIP